jgi:hypothetical protein
MTFKFLNWTQAFPFHPAQNTLLRAPSRRAPLVAHWERAADGRLECRWMPVDPVTFLD